MTDLFLKLNAIYTEKENKIKPENIKKDIQIFDIVGTLEPEIENLTVNPTTSQQVFNHSNKDGYDTVTVNAVTSSIDINIQPENIKKDVTILGVTGTYEG